MRRTAMISSILEFREKLKALYARFDMIVDVVVKFLIAFVSLKLMMDNIGFFQTMKNPFILLMVSLACSILPYGITAFILAVLVLLNVYKVSLEMTVILSVLFIVIGLLYYGFQPGDSYLLMLTPIAFALRIPYVVPLLAGLGCSFVSVVPVSAGVMICYVIRFIRENAGMLTNDEAVDITQKYLGIISELLADKEMWMMIAAFVFALIVVYLIHLLPFNYSWYAAVAAGMIILFVFIFAGTELFEVDVPLGGVVAGVLISGVLAELYTFFIFMVDYSRTEYTQFEDDSYYYYVKAVPKLTVSRSEVKIQKFSTGKKEE